MNDQTSTSQELVANCFRHNQAKMVAVLVHYFGLSDVEIAEDIVQETLLEALTKWRVGPLPHNPDGWLMDVAKKKAINRLRRDRLLREKVLPKLAGETAVFHDQINFSHTLIQDSTLRMIFAACHPSLPPSTQVALALKTLCGLSISEIADALLTNKATINKRLYRAKQKFRDQTIQFEMPQGDALKERLDAVFATLYLLFNEGYYSRHHQKLIRIDLCLDAVRLQREVVAAFPNTAKGKALLSLMLFSFARFESRLDEQGLIVLFAKQNRALWDQALIAEGLDYLHQSIQGNELNSYQLQAGIAAEHCLAPDFAATNWGNIVRQYALLQRLDDSITVRLNKAIAQFFCGDEQAALTMILPLEKELSPQQQTLYHATLGLFYDKLKQPHRARVQYEAALRTSRSQVERAFIQQQLAD